MPLWKYTVLGRWRGFGEDVGADVVVGLWRDDSDDEEVEEDGVRIFPFRAGFSLEVGLSFSVEVVSSRGDQELLSGGQGLGDSSADGANGPCGSEGEAL